MRIIQPNCVGPLPLHRVHFFCARVDRCATPAGGLPLQELHHIEWHSFGHGAASMNLRTFCEVQYRPFPAVPVCVRHERLEWRSWGLWIGDEQAVTP